MNGRGNHQLEDDRRYGVFFSLLVRRGRRPVHSPTRPFNLEHCANIAGRVLCARQMALAPLTSSGITHKS